MHSTLRETVAMRKEQVHMVVLYLKSNGYFYILLKYYDIITLNPLIKLNQFNQKKLYITSYKERDIRIRTQISITLNYYIKNLTGNYNINLCQ